MRKCSIFIILLFMMVLPLSVYAEPSTEELCDGLDVNEEWKKSINEIIEHINEEMYSQALEKAKNLEEVCSRSPILNYLEGGIEQQLGNNDEALKYYIRASEETYEFSTNSEVVKKIWYARFKLENDSLSLDDKIELMSFDISFHKHKNIDKTNFRYRSKSEDYKKLLWTGIGLDFGGIALLVSSGLLMLDDNYKVPLFILLGSGSALLITGTVIASVFGYRYKHLHDKTAYQINISPNYSSFSIQF